MKTKVQLLILSVMAIVTLMISGAQAQEVIVSGGSDSGSSSGGSGTSTNSVAWHFGFAKDGSDTTWQAGSTQRIVYDSQGLSGSYMSAMLKNDPLYYGAQVSSHPILADGIFEDAFKVPFGTTPGIYKLQTTVYDSYYGYNLTTITSSWTVTITSSITFPQADDVLKVGHNYRVKWVNQDITKDFFTMYLISDRTGDFWPLGSKAVRNGNARVHIPGGLPPGNYRISLRSWYSSGATSESFTIANPKWKGNPGPTTNPNKVIPGKG